MSHGIIPSLPQLRRRTAGPIRPEDWLEIKRMDSEPRLYYANADEGRGSKG
jgi:hypothetical protein